MSGRTKLTLAVALAAVLGAPASAGAHVTLQPSSAPAGGFTRLDVRVPNERDDSATTKVDIKLPPGFLSVAYEPVPGWKVKVTKEKLAKPVKVEGFDVHEQVSTITWSGGTIAPGQFRDFGISTAMPKGKPGSKLTFKALQTYDDGEVVRWIGPENADEPAPTVTLTQAGVGGGHGAPSQPAAGAAAPAQGEAGDDGGTDALTVVALVLAALGLLAGGAGLLVARRATRSRSGAAA